jgi:hypothetical protein
MTRLYGCALVPIMQSTRATPSAYMTCAVALIQCGALRLFRASAQLLTASEDRESATCLGRYSDYAKYTRNGNVHQDLRDAMLYSDFAKYTRNSGQLKALENQCIFAAQ